MYTMKDNRKILTALLLTAALLSSLIIGAASGFMSDQSTHTNLADYVTFEGVAGTDYYDGRQYSYMINTWANKTYDQSYQYPFNDPSDWFFNANKSLRIGLTEFGEFATDANTGIAYGFNQTEFVNTESWASSSGIMEKYFIQGWTFYMNYTSSTELRAIEAYAIFSDMKNNETGRLVTSWKGSKNAGADGWTPVNGSLVTSGIQVLYDSARLAVGRTSVTIYDNYEGTNVAKITFTVVLNKDTKYAIIYKDLKILLPEKSLDKINDIAFSERYEIDLASKINPSNNAYIHWFKDYNVSTYQHPLTADVEYDIVQAFDAEQKYIFFAAYWPNTTECTVYGTLVPNLAAGITGMLSPGTKVLDMPVEPETPWVIAQWRYNFTQYPNMLTFLTSSPNREIRFVEIVGMTDYNNYDGAREASNGASLDWLYMANDINSTAIGYQQGHINSIDTEVRYLLDDLFNPEDLGHVADDPFMWVALGQTSATSDSAGGVAISDFGQFAMNEPLGLLDRNDTGFPWTKGTIPFGLSNNGDFNPNSIATFNNLAHGFGTDPTTFYRTGLNNFAFNKYDGEDLAPQPIAGGFSHESAYWYPSINPLHERWSSGPWENASYYYANDNGIISLGGAKANGITRYFNDFNFAITREGTTTCALVNGKSVSGSAPTSNPSLGTIDYFPISTWNSSATTFGYSEDYAVISVARDINGTRGLTVYGWNGRDTYWAANWASQYLSEMELNQTLGDYNEWIPDGTVAIILKMTYPDASSEPTMFTVVKALGTITEFGTNYFTQVQTTAFRGYDTITLSGLTVDPWNLNSVLSVRPPHTLSTEDGLVNNPSEYYGQWWYAKFHTHSIASVQFDP